MSEKGEAATSANEIPVENSLAAEGSVEQAQSDGVPVRERTYFCKICDIGFSTFPSLKDHLGESHTVKITSKSYYCQACEREFSLQCTFQNHLHREHTFVKADACSKCHFKLPHEKTVPTHPSGDSYLVHHCVVCEAQMKANHGKARTGGRKKRAPPSKDDVRQTVLKAIAEKKSYMCKVCHKTYFSSVNHDHHLLTMHGIRSDKPHRCATCDRGFLTLGSMKTHELREHVESKPHACGKCGRRFKFERQLQGHLTGSHHPPKQRCEVCLKVVTRLRDHMRAHLGIRPHACVACGEAFTTLAKLKMHLLTHTGERPYVCETCGYAFSRKVHLQTHSRVHTGERPYVCEFCGRGFTQKWVMVAHRRTHTGERPFECDVCQRGFIYKSQMKTHRLACVKKEPRIDVKLENDESLV